MALLLLAVPNGPRGNPFTAEKCCVASHTEFREWRVQIASYIAAMVPENVLRHPQRLSRFSSHSFGIWYLDLYPPLSLVFQLRYNH